MGFFKGLVFATLTLGAALFVLLNHFGAIERPNPCYDSPISPVTAASVIDGPLAEFREVIGHDFEAYHNHIYRVYTFTLHFLACMT